MKKLFQLFIVGIILPTLHAQNFEWGYSTGSTATIYASSIVADENNNTVLVGYFSDTVDFDPGPGVFNLIGNNDVFILKLDSSGGLVWAKRISTGSAIEMKDVALDSNGNIYATGIFQNFVDFDPDTSTYVLTAPGSFEYEVFILKLDDAGNFIWAKNMGGSNGDYVTQIFIDDSMNVYTTGSFRQSADFDPGPGVSSLFSPGLSVGNAFLSKLDSSGNYVWAVGIGNTGDEYGNDINVDHSGNVYWTGTFTTPILDADPGPGSFNLTCAGSSDGFFVHLDQNGNFIDVKHFTGTSFENLTRSEITPDGSFYISGQFTGTADFDPGPAVSNLTASGIDAFVVKLDTGGNFSWAKQIMFYGVMVDPPTMTSDVFSNVYLNGSFEDTIDFDPGLGVFNMSTTPGYHEAYTVKLDSAGNFVWAGSIEGNNHVDGHCIDVSNSGNIFASGRMYGSSDLDPGPLTNNVTVIPGTIDMYVTNLSQDFCSNLTCIFDSASNLSCSNQGLAYIHASGGIAPYTYTWNTIPATLDSVAAFDSTGIYTITITDFLGCAESRNLLINGPASTIYSDLEVNFVTTSFRPGVDTYHWLDGFNDGCISQSGSLFLILDTLVTFVNSTPMPDYINADTLRWDFSSINYSNPHLAPAILLHTSATAVIGDSIYVQTFILPTVGDIDTTNNVKNYLFPVVNGYDPNDKKVYPEGVCPEAYVFSNELLTYTIRFQNTGNAEAINIFIMDTLSANFDLNSLRVVSHSHSLITEILPSNVVNFRFDNIMLPDSNTNEQASHGYVIFEIMPDSNISSGTQVSNTAHIFFDFNPAIITNTVSNTLVNSIPNCTVNSIEEIENWATAFPNPFSTYIHISTFQELKDANIQVINFHGQTLLQKSHIDGNHFTFDLSTLSSGMYFIHLYSEGKRAMMKVIKN